MKNYFLSAMVFSVLSLTIIGCSPDESPSTPTVNTQEFTLTEASKDNNDKLNNEEFQNSNSNRAGRNCVGKATGSSKAAAERNAQNTLYRLQCYKRNKSISFFTVKYIGVWHSYATQYN